MTRKTAHIYQNLGLALNLILNLYCYPQFSYLYSK